MTDLTLYSMPSSGNSYKVRLLLSILGRTYRHVGMEYETPELDSAHAAKTLPLNKLPVLELPDRTRIPESNAILCYLAEGTEWMPSDPVAKALTLGWMFWEQNQHEGVIAVRAAILTYESRKHLRTPERLAELLDNGHKLLAMMDDALSTRNWIAIDRPTVADISLYAYTHSAATKGGYDLDHFANVTSWLNRMAALPGHVTLTDIPA